MAMGTIYRGIRGGTKVICPKCKEEGRKSRVSGGFGMITSMGWSPYYDEEGVYHSHDPNTFTHEYTCSNGHRIVRKGHEKCPACDYGDEVIQVMS